jgi:hypothetical protein
MVPVPPPGAASVGTIARALVEMLAQESRDVELVVAVKQRIRLELLSLRQARILAAPPIPPL